MRRSSAKCANTLTKQPLALSRFGTSALGRASPGLHEKRRSACTAKGVKEGSRSAVRGAENDALTASRVDTRHAFPNPDETQLHGATKGSGTAWTAAGRLGEPRAQVYPAGGHRWLRRRLPDGSRSASAIHLRMACGEGSWSDRGSGYPVR
jgi:hypothetical protein